MPAESPTDVVEQRILEQASRLPASGAVTGWAALRWSGAAFFDGRSQGGRVELPVPLVIGKPGNLRPDSRVALSWEQFPPRECEVVAGLSCAVIARALFDEVRRTRDLRASVVAIDMAAAAGLISVEEFAGYVGLRQAWTGVIQARKAVGLASDDSRSPQESWMRYLWVVEAALPRPLCNQPVFGPGGELLGYPDLLDPEAGVVGEYDGADHLVEDRRRSDREREERFRDHGLECFVVVRGEMSDASRVARRMHAARERALWQPPERRRWTLEWPAWYAALRARNRRAA